MAQSKKSVLADADMVTQAAQLVALGARLQVIQSEFPTLSRDRCLGIYREVTGDSPPKGPLPFSTDWFLTRAPNAHASLFMGIAQRMEDDNPDLTRTGLLIAAYEVYKNTVDCIENPAILTITRAWSLYRHVASGVLRMMPCDMCQGHFVVDPYDIAGEFVCTLCNVEHRPGPRMSLDSKHYQQAQSIGFAAALDPQS